MYSTRPGYILGFHGCDEEVALKIVNRQSNDLEFSTNKWDWLGEGMYFWENNNERAYAWAFDESQKQNGRIKKPAVLGAIIALGNCLDLLDNRYLEIVKNSHTYFITLCDIAKTKVPENVCPRSAAGNPNDKFIRNLDCSVIQTTHTMYSKDDVKFDSVRGMFVEGQELYSGAGFRAKDHIQIAVRNPNCIKGYFLPKSLNVEFKRV